MNQFLAMSVLATPPFMPFYIVISVYILLQ